MSGPKVVRIVTREEIIAICEGHLARLNAAVEVWIKVGRRNDVLTEVEIAATRERQDALRRLLAEDRFAELQKAVPVEIDFLTSDQEARLMRAALMKAKARSARRQAEAAAGAVLRALERKGVTVPIDLRRALEQVAAGSSEDANAISQAFALLSVEEKTLAVSDRQRELAAKHKEKDDRQSFDEWLAANSPNAGDKELTRLNLRLAELAVTLGDSATKEFEARLHQLSSDNPPANRSLLVDSLEIDLIQAVAQARQRSALKLRLIMLAEELAAVDSENARSISRTILSQVDQSSDLLVQLEKEAKEVLRQRREETAALSRRQAVLKGLTQLGYQVTEGLETAWVQNGRVVLKRRSQPGYGVEISGTIDSGRVQMRTVAIRDAGSAIDSAGDRDAETLFCSDVSRLQKKFGEEGGEVLIERALPIGASPLKIVSESADVRNEERRVPPSAKQRTIS